MANILSKPKPQHSGGRNGFDLSFHRSFTSPAGMLLPVASDFAYSGEKYRLNSSLLIRTLPLQTAAFMRLKAHVEWHFVPVMHLYSLWNNVYNGTLDIHTSALFNSSNPSQECPFPLHDVQDYLDSPALFLDAGSSGSPVRQTDEFGVPLEYNFRRLWDMLDYGSLKNTWEGTSNLTLLLLDFLAYHRIFYSHYNLSDWFSNDPTYYNVDKFWNTGKVDAATTKKIISTMHYRPWRKDYFTNIFPAPTFSSAFANVINTSLTDGSNLESKLNYEGLRGNTISSKSSSTQGAYAGVGSTMTLNGSNPDFSVGDLRSMYALDKLLRTTALAGSHYDQQTLAHLGYKTPEGISGESYFIGSQETPIIITQVVATATTNAQEDGKPLAGSTIGDIAGKAYGSTDGMQDLTFTAPCEGILMAIFSIEPLPDYGSKGMQPQKRYKSMLDFWHPELDNIGMQPIRFASYDLENNGDIDIYGWQYRFSELKMRYDVVNESFWDTGLSTWVGIKQNYAVPDSTNFDARGYFFIRPQYTNDIFMSDFGVFVTPGSGPSDTSWSSSSHNSIDCYSGDNFLVDADFKMYKTSLMSTYSLPKF